MTPKTLSVDLSKCTGCMDCVSACAIKYRNVEDPVFSRIYIVHGDNDDGFYLPITCRQCEDPPCVSACPNQAIYRDDELNRVMIRLNLCIGCRMCVAACPFGAMAFNKDRGFAFKCDLCDGKPECVRVCEPKALDFVEGHTLHYPRMRDAAMRQYQVMRKMVV